MRDPERSAITCGDRAAKREPFFIFTFFFLLYAATSSGDVIADSEIRWDMARQLVDTAWVALETGNERLMSKGVDGEWYAFYGPGQPVCRSDEPLTPPDPGGRPPCHENTVLI